MGSDDVATRMAGTLALVLAIDVAFALIAAALLEPWLESPLAGAGVGSRLARYGVVVAGLVAVLLWAQLRYTRRELLAEADAEPVTDDSHPDLSARVTRLASLADQRRPSIAVAPADTPNSFAVGGLRGGTIVVSEGLLERLDGDELDAVLAHELAHLGNRDALVMTLASFLPSLVADDYSLLEDVLPSGASSVFWAVVVLCCYVLSSAFIDAPLASFAGLAQFALAAAVTVLVGGVALGLLATPVVFLSRSLSRQREFVADRAGARLAGSPAALAAALRTLDDAAEPPAEDARGRYEGLEGMCLLPHGFDSGEENEADDAFTVQTRSHPPTDERIARLRELASEMETGE